MSSTRNIADYLNGPTVDPYVSEWFCKFLVDTSRRDVGWFVKNMLFCTFNGRRYRVTGVTRTGDIWLVENPTQSFTFDCRVDVAKCSQFSRTWKVQPTQ